jgi:serine beta-lactamase-like protein LACTB
LGAVYEKAVAAAIKEKGGFDVSFQKQLTQFFKSLDLNDTYLDLNDELIPNRSRYYQRDEKGGLLVNAPYVDNSYKWAGGGVLSNVTDLCRLGDELIRCWQNENDDDEVGIRFLKSSTMKNVWSPQVKRDSNEEMAFLSAKGMQIWYGLGWNLAMDQQGQLNYVYHTGGAVGASSCLFMDPRTGIVVAVLCNLQGAKEIVNFCYRLSQVF